MSASNLRTGWACFLGLLLASAASAQWNVGSLPREEVLARRDAEWTAAVTTQFLKDDLVPRETGIGIEIRGPDPFRDVGDVESKLVGSWRLGFNQFDFEYLDPRLRRTVSSEVLIVNVGLGYDYFIKRSSPSPFVGLHIHGLVPFRDQKLPGIRDRPEAGLDLSLGYRLGRGSIRID